MKVKRRFRHRLTFFLLKPLFRLYFRVFYRFKAERFKPPKDLKGPYLIIGNHSTPFDPFFMALSIRGPVYFVASDMIFSVKYLSSIMKFLVGPIPKTKYRSDLETIRDMKRILDDGGNVALFPEGNTTFHGAQMPMPFVIAKLIKKFRVPVLFYTIEGGYLARPRWGKKRRIGRIKGRIRRVWRPHEYESLSPEAIYDTVKTMLTVDEFEGKVPFKSSQKAEDLESAYFICPSCASFETIRSKGDDAWCVECDFHVRMNPYGMFENIGGTRYFTTTVPWYEYQKEQLRHWIDEQDKEALLFEDHGEKVLKVERSKHKHYVGHCTVRLFKDHVLFLFDDGTEERFDLNTVKCAVQQKNKLILHDTSLSKTYYLLSHPKRNALKYTLAIEALHDKKERD